MNEKNDDLYPDNLVDGYRRIEAPPHLATRIRAEVSDKRIRSQAWMPAAATMMVAIAAIWLLPFIGQQQADVSGHSIKPSFSAIASLKLRKPDVKSPSLAQLRSVKTPRMPQKPTLRSVKPQTNLIFDNEHLEEQEHANS